MAVSNVGVFTFEHGFVYRVFYQVSCRFVSSTGFLITGFKRTDNQQIATGSTTYIALATSSTDTPIASACFYLDLRNDVAPVQYTVSITGSLNVFQIYRAYSSISCEQIQQISD